MITVHICNVTYNNFQSRRDQINLAFSTSTTIEACTGVNYHHKINTLCTLNAMYMHLSQKTHHRIPLQEYFFDSASICKANSLVGERTRAVGPPRASRGLCSSNYQCHYFMYHVHVNAYIHVYVHILTINMNESRKQKSKCLSCACLLGDKHTIKI